MTEYHYDLQDEIARLVEKYGARAVVATANDEDRPGLWDTTRHLWGDDTADLTEAPHPYALFVERIVEAWDPSEPRTDSARRLMRAVQEMIDEWEATS